MKKKLFNSFLAILLLTTILSCNKDLTVNKITPSTLIDKTPNDSNFVSLSVATIAAKQVKNSHIINQATKEKAINGLNAIGTKQVLDTLAVPNNVNPSYYIFNYVGGGYVIIPSDKRVEPILAYADKGYFKKSGKLPSGLINWLSVNHKNMQLLRSNTTLKIPAKIAKLWYGPR